MIHVEITNFESIRNISFDIDGFTTIVGRNFIGKSAVLKAINAALTNASGTGFITWGETFCEVHIKSDRIDLLWHKEDSNNFYVINGIKYEKIGKDDPPNVVFEAGLGATSIGKDKINLLYVEQFFPLFLVDKKDSKGIDLLTAAYGLDKVYKAIDLCNKDQRSNKDMLRIRKKDLEILTEDIKKFDGFDEVLTQKVFLLESKKNLEQKEKKIEKLKELFRRVSILSQQVRILQDIRDLEIPKNDKLKESYDKSKRLLDLNQGLIRAAEVVNNLKSVETISIPEGLSSLEGMQSKIKKAAELNGRYSSLEQSVRTLEVIKSVEIPKMPDLDIGRIDALESTMKKLIENKVSYVNLEAKLKDLNSEEKNLLEEKEQFNGMCPLCGKELEECKDV